jgi:RND family efflux transporter, MFP subunit
MATKEVALKSQMAGKYLLQVNPNTRRPYKLGDKVRKGEVIVRFEDAEYVNSLAVETKKLNLTIAEQEQTKQKALYEKGGVTLSEMRNSEVKVANAQTDYNNAILKQDYMKVVAPFDGVIVDLPHYTSDTKVESGSSIVSIMDYGTLYMDINLPENAINYVSPDQKVFITHYTLPNDTLQGIIKELSPAINQETRTFKGKLSIENNSLKLRPGMFVKADIIVDRNENAIVIPKNIIMSRGNQNKYIYILDNNIARRREITTGIEDQYNVEVVDGLKEGDIIITKGYETLRNESKVKVEK